MTDLDHCPAPVQDVQLLPLEEPSRAHKHTIGDVQLKSEALHFMSVGLMFCGTADVCVCHLSNACDSPDDRKHLLDLLLRSQLSRIGERSGTAADTQILRGAIGDALE